MPDVRKIAALSADAPLALALYRPLGAGAGALGFKVYRRGAPVVLSDSLPMLEHMGVRVLGEQHAERRRASPTPRSRCTTSSLQAHG